MDLASIIFGVTGLTIWGSITLWLLAKIEDEGRNKPRF